MSAKFVRRMYGVTYKRGDRLIVNDRHGTLVSFPSQYLGVRFDGNHHTTWCHPTWDVIREEPTTSPECRDGKHANCDGDALDPTTDEIIHCGCDCHAGEDHA